MLSYRESSGGVRIRLDVLHMLEVVWIWDILDLMLALVTKDISQIHVQVWNRDVAIDVIKSDEWYMNGCVMEHLRLQHST